MLQSMTGYGRGINERLGKTFTVEIKSVNHKYFDCYIRSPRQLIFLDEKTRSYLSKNISRGKVDVFISLEDGLDAEKEVTLDIGLAKAYKNAVQDLCEALDIENKSDSTLQTLLRFPDVIKPAKKDDGEDELWNGLFPALEAATANFIRMREKEAEYLAGNIILSIDIIKKITDELTQKTKFIADEYKQKLESRIKDLRASAPVDENRIALELILYLDKCDVSEELTRLESHVNQLTATIQSKGPAGKKLDFLAQETNREINTIGAKSQDLKISRAIIELKCEVEKIREQIQNIE